MLNESGPVAASRVVTELARLEARADSLARAVGLQEIDGFLIVTDETVEDGRAEYRGSNAASQVDIAILQRITREAVMTERLDQVGVDPRLVAQATIPLDLRTVTIRGGEATEQSGEATFLLAYFMWF